MFDILVVVILWKGYVDGYYGYYYFYYSGFNFFFWLL